MIRLSILLSARQGGSQLYQAVRSVLDCPHPALECLVVAPDDLPLPPEILELRDSRFSLHRLAGIGQQTGLKGEACGPSTPGSDLSNPSSPEAAQPSNGSRPGWGREPGYLNPTVCGWNQGWGLAKGAWIALLEERDRFLPEALNSLVDSLTDTRARDVVYADCQVVDATDRDWGTMKLKSPTVKNLARRSCLADPAVFYRRELRQECGELDGSARHASLYQWWVTLACHGKKFEKADRIVARRLVRSHDENHSIAFYQEVIGMLMAQLGTCGSRWLVRYGRKVAEKEGWVRGNSMGYDVAVLRHGIQALRESSPEALSPVTEGMHSVRAALRHSLSEIRHITKRPRSLMRFVPVAQRRWLPRSSTRRIFQLRIDTPYPCTLPKSYFTTENPVDPPSISIATPSLNQGVYIERTLRSVLDQEYPRLEYVVQDGLSRDQSIEVIKRYASRLSHWESAKDSGQSQAINRGLQRTSGEIMAYLNSDDLLVPGCLATVATYFQQHPEVDVVYGYRLLIDDDDQVINHWVLPEHDSETLKWADYIPQETMFWRRSAWEAVGGHVDESFQFAMDWDLILRFQAANRTFARIPRFLGAFRITDSQKTSQQLSSHGLTEMSRLRKRTLGFVPTEREVSRQIRKYIRRQRRAEQWYHLNERVQQLFDSKQPWNVLAEELNAVIPYPSSFRSAA